MAEAWTLPRAADHLGVPVSVLQGWRDTGHLVTIVHPVSGVEMVDVDHLLEVDFEVRQGTPRPARLAPMDARTLADWLTGCCLRPVTMRAVIDAVHDGDLTRCDDGGPGVRALYNPHQARAVFAARQRRIPVTAVIPTQRQHTTRKYPAR